MKDALQFPVQPRLPQFPAWLRAGGSPAAAPSQAVGLFPRVEAMAAGRSLALVTPGRSSCYFSPGAAGIWAAVKAHMVFTTPPCPPREMSLQVVPEVCGQLGGAAMLCDARQAPLSPDCLSSQREVTSRLLGGAVPSGVARAREVPISVPETELDRLCKQKRQSMVKGTSPERADANPEPDTSQ